MGYRVGGGLDVKSRQAGTPDQLLLGPFLFQFGDSSLDGFYGFLHGLGIGPEYLHFIGSAYRIAGTIRRWIGKSAVGRADAAATSPAESASKSHSSAAVITAAVNRQVGWASGASAEPPATAGHGTGPSGTTSV